MGRSPHQSRPSTACVSQNGARPQGFASPRQNRARPCVLCAVLPLWTRDGRLRRDDLSDDYLASELTEANNLPNRLHRIPDTPRLRSVTSSIATNTKFVLVFFVHSFRA